MFNISRLSISNQLYPDLDDQLVRGVEKTRLYCGPPSSWGGSAGVRSRQGVFHSGRPGGGVGIQWWLVGRSGVDPVWSPRGSEFLLRTFTFQHGPRPVCQPSRGCQSERWYGIVIPQPLLRPQALSRPAAHTTLKDLQSY